MDTEELPPGWAWAKLDELGFWTGGGTPSKTNPSFWSNGTVPWVSPKDMKSYHVGEFAERITEQAVERSAANLIAAGSVLCVIRSGILNHTFPVAIAAREVTVNQDMRALTTHTDIDPRYVALFLQANNNEILHTCSKDGTTVASIEMRHLQAFPVPLAPHREQVRIVDYLETTFAELDEAEAALERAQDGIDQFRSSLLHAACTGQLTAAWREANPPSETGADLLRRISASRRPSGFEKTLRFDALDTPPGWVVCRLGDLITEGPTNGISPKASEDGSGTLSLKLTATTRGAMDLSTRATKRLCVNVPPQSNLFLREGDVLFQRGNTIEYVGIAAIYDGPENTYVFPDLMIRVRCANQFIAEWLWRSANAPAGRAYMQQFATGTAGTMPKISGAILRELPIRLPPESEMLELLRCIREHLLDCEAAEQEHERLRSQTNILRQSILYAAFTGRLVPQDVTDEAAATLLTQLRAAPAQSRRPRRRLSAEAAQ